MTSYSPGQVAEKTGFSVDTLRYYERIGLLHAIDRTAGGRRRYTDTDVFWLHLLRCLRDTGMPIEEMRRFVELSRSGDDTLPQRLTLLEENDQRVEKQIARLRADQQQLRTRSATTGPSSKAPMTLRSDGAAGPSIRLGHRSLGQSGRAVAARLTPSSHRR